VSRLSRQCGILNISQPYRPPRPVTGIALLLYFFIAGERPQKGYVRYIHIFIFTDKTAVFEQWPSSEDSARLHPVFTSLGFVTAILYRARSAALRPTPNLGAGPCVCPPPSTSPTHRFPLCPFPRLAGLLRCRYCNPSRRREMDATRERPVARSGSRRNNNTILSCPFHQYSSYYIRPRRLFLSYSYIFSITLSISIIF
jgi:hypothetical protein